MSGIARINSKINEALGLNSWGERELIANDFNHEIVETNQEFQGGAIDATKIKNLKVDTIEITQGGYIRSGKTSFTDTSNPGFIIDPNGIFIGNNADTVSFKFDVPNETLTLKGATITNGLFSVDALGNATVNSLSRNDYHIFSMFESVDGYDKTASGLGTVTVDGSGINIVTGHYNTNKNTAKKRLASSLGLSWDKKTNIKVSLNQSSDATGHIWIACGDISTNVKRHIGFYKNDDTFYGTCGNNTSESTVSLGVISSGLLELRYTPGVSIKYYLDGTYIDEITTNLPSGEVSADIIINLSAENTDATDVNTVSMIIGWYDFWQSN